MNSFSSRTNSQESLGMENSQESIFQSQREAALRRRRQYLRNSIASKSSLALSPTESRQSLSYEEFPSSKSIHAFDDSPSATRQEIDSKNIQETTPIRNNNAPNDFLKYFNSIDWEDPKAIKKIMMQPIPKELGIVKCKVKRNKKKNQYRLYLENETGTDDKFLMSAKKRKKKATSNYLISISRNDLNKGSDNIIGKLRANFSGTIFQVFGSGRSPKDVDDFYDERNEEPLRKEHGVIMYDNCNEKHSNGPRRIQFCIPKLDSNDRVIREWQPETMEESMIESVKASSMAAMQNLFYMKSRQPSWNEGLSSYVLNFNKRVSLSSKKNFQLINQNEKSEAVLLQFGRTKDDEFIMDAQWPFSLFQAFACSLSSCDSKLGID